MSTRKLGRVTVILRQFENASNQGTSLERGAIERTLYVTRVLGSRRIGCATLPLVWGEIHYVEINGKKWPVSPCYPHRRADEPQREPYAGIYELDLPHGEPVPEDADADAWAAAEKAVCDRYRDANDRPPTFGDRDAAVVAELRGAAA